MSLILLADLEIFLSLNAFKCCLMLALPWRIVLGCAIKCFSVRFRDELEFSFVNAIADNFSILKMTFLKTTGVLFV